MSLVVSVRGKTVYESKEKGPILTEENPYKTLDFTYPFLRVKLGEDGPYQQNEYSFNASAWTAFEFTTSDYGKYLSVRVIFLGFGFYFSRQVSF